MVGRRERRGRVAILLPYCLISLVNFLAIHLPSSLISPVGVAIPLPLCLISLVDFLAIHLPSSLTSPVDLIDESLEILLQTV